MYKQLNLSYLSDIDMMMIECGFITYTLTSVLMDATIGKRLELTTEQLQLLANDISMAKSLGLWDANTEEQTVDSCYKRYKRVAEVKRLSPSDREIYFQKVTKNLFII